MSQTFDFSQVGRLPLPGDNVAIAVQRLQKRAAQFGMAMTPFNSIIP